MSLFSQAGIYTIIDLSLPQNGSIDRLQPTWTTSLLNIYTKSIDAFSKYDNVLAYNIGNEVVISPNGTSAGPFVKAAARDIKAYLASKSSSALVGYAAIDGGWRRPFADYLGCDPSGANSGATSLDLYGLNNYGWCGNSTFDTSYAGVLSDFTSYQIPSYFSEFGCITSPPRLWTEVASLFSSQMSDVWSGGIAFSYLPATSAQGQFGMVTVSSDGKTVTPNADFTRLKAQYGAISPPTTPDQASSPATTYPACPPQDTTIRASTSLPRTPNAAACSCMDKILSCRFTPQTKNTTGVLVQLFDFACGSSMHVNCQDIAADGVAGSYGRVSGCSPNTKLSFVMSEFYEANGRNAQACSFNGNGTVNAAAPSSVQAANAAATSCFSNAPDVFTPSAVAPGATSTQGTNIPKQGGASALFEERNSLKAFGMMVFVCIMSGLWTLT
jgi:hypothetical protein